MLVDSINNMHRRKFQGGNCLKISTKSKLGNVRSTCSTDFPVKPENRPVLSQRCAPWSWENRVRRKGWSIISKGRIWREKTTNRTTTQSALTLTRFKWRKVSRFPRGVIDAAPTFAPFRFTGRRVGCSVLRGQVNESSRLSLVTPSHPIQVLYKLKTK